MVWCYSEGITSALLARKVPSCIVSGFPLGPNVSGRAKVSTADTIASDPSASSSVKGATCHPKESNDGEKAALQACGFNDVRWLPEETTPRQCALRYSQRQARSSGSCDPQSVTASSTTKAASPLEWHTSWGKAPSDRCKQWRKRTRRRTCPRTTARCHARGV